MDVPQEELHGYQQLDPEWPLQGQIEFQNVTLRYIPSLPAALKDVSFIIPGGMQVIFIYFLIYTIFISRYVLNK